MTAAAVILMITILGLVWGGFVFALALALKKESQKAETDA
ncbi:MAG: methionine/alanine import family NSS transporter small subunit [bacterium]